jgi:hypothetical protein
LTSSRPIPPDSHTSELSERDGDARVTINEAPIKVAKTKERLNILNLPWNGPIRDSGYFVRSHAETVWRQNVAEVLAGGDSKLAFRQFAIQPSFTKTSENLPDVSGMRRWVVRVHQDVIEVYNDVNIQQIREDRVEEALKSSRCIGQTFQNDLEIVGAVARAESGFVLVTRGDTEQMVSVAKV